MLWALFFSLLLAGLCFRFTGLEWWGWGDAIINLATLAVGVVIWYAEAAEDWEESLPKRLTAEFWFAPAGQPARPVMICRHAPLAGESDLRTWGIALGGRMDAGKRQLKYQPYFTTLPPEIIPDATGQPCRHYLIRFTMDELPERLTNSKLPTATPSASNGPPPSAASAKPSTPAPLPCHHDFALRPSDFFRTSDFGLRTSQHAPNRRLSRRL